MSVTTPTTQTATQLPVKKILTVSSFVLVAVGAGVVGAMARIPDGQVAPGVHIMNLDLSGKTLAEAKTAIEQWSVERGKSKFTLRFAPETGIKKKWTPNAEKIGLGIDVSATTDAAMKVGHDNLLGQVTSLVTGRKTVQVPPVVKLDEAKLKTYLRKQITPEITQKPKNAQFVLLPGGGFGTKHEVNGISLDLEKSLSTVKQDWVSTQGGAIQKESSQKAPLPSSAIPASEGKPEEKTETAPPATTEKKENVSKIDDTPSKSAVVSEFPESILSAKVVKPEIVFEDISQIDTLLASKTSFVGGTSDRLNNIRVAASHINKTLLKPGQIFSYNATVGPRNEDTGFREAPILIAGRHDKGIGGGICQTSGTLFNAVLKSGLKIVHREPHSTTIAYLPRGLDATVSYGSIDFQFQNNTAAPVYLQASLNGRKLYFALYGKKVPGREVSLVQTSFSSQPAGSYTERDSSLPAGRHVMKEHGASGYNITWVRVIKENDQEVSRDVIHSRYRPVPAVVLVGTKSRPKPKKPASALLAPTEGATPPTAPSGGTKLE